MINIDNIGNLKKCRIWLEEFSVAKHNAVEVLSSALKASDSIIKNDQSVAVELFAAPRYYALLGVEYIYKDTGKLEIYINTSEDSEKISDSLALPSDNVQSGIPKEYAQTVLNTTIKVFRNLYSIPSGILTFSVGAYGNFGSNQVIFAKATGILIGLLVGKLSNMELDELKNIVRNELNKPLTDFYYDDFKDK